MLAQSVARRDSRKLVRGIVQHRLSSRGVPGLHHTGALAVDKYYHAIPQGLKVLQLAAALLWKHGLSGHCML